MRYIYWDKVLVVDDEFDENLLKKLNKISQTKGFNKSGGIEVGDVLDTKNSNYSFKELDKDISKQVETEIDRLNVLPIDKEKRVLFRPRLHKLKKGGKLDRHNDGMYSLAISLYFNECEGGELKVENGDGQNILIEPKWNRLVMLKGENNHQVNTVHKGVRNSLQVFTQYNLNDSDENRSST